MANSKEKEILEELLMEHFVGEGKIIIKKDEAYSLLKSLGVLNDGKIDSSRSKEIIREKEGNEIFQILHPSQ